MSRLALAALVVTLAGCRIESASETPEADTLAVPSVAPGDTVAASAGTPRTDADAEAGCTLVAQDSVVLYTRPSVAAPRWGTLAPGDSVQAAGRAPGFVGIAPGTAQAANVGPFRLRYAASDGPFALRGDCTALPAQPRLDPVACYQMALGETRLHARPDTAAATVATLPAGGFAEATSRTPSGWLRVRLPAGGPPGWVAPDDANVSGAACETL